MTDLVRYLATIALVLLPPASIALCIDEVSGSDATVVENFIAFPSLAPSTLSFRLADLRGSGSLELVQGSVQLNSDDLHSAPSIALLLARERSAGNSYKTRAALRFNDEYFLAAEPIDGALFGIDGTVVILITRAKFGTTTRMRVINGDSWQSVRQCETQMAAIGAAITPASASESREIYLQDAHGIQVFSLPEWHRAREIVLGGGGGFALAQLDSDASIEVIVAGVPGRVIDGDSGNLEWEYAPGFEMPIVAGKFGESQQVGFAGARGSNIEVYEPAPYAMTWAIPVVGTQGLAAADVNGDGRDELLVAGSYQITMFQGAHGVRVFDVPTRTMTAFDSEPRFDILGFAALPARTGTGIEVLLEQDQTLRVHSLGAPDLVWTERAERAPFSAMADMTESDVQDQRILVSGSSTGTRSAILHVVATSTWSEVGTSPGLHSPNSIDVRHVGDLLSLRTGPSSPPAVAVGGDQISAAIAAVDPNTWVGIWDFGTDNSPNVPLPFHSVQRMTAHDLNMDGYEDVVVGAGLFNNGATGARVVAFDGRDGSELWRSDALGGYFEKVTDLDIFDVPSGNATSGMAVVTGTFGVAAFDMQAPDAIWTIASPALATSKSSNGNWFVSSADGGVHAFGSALDPLWDGGSYRPAQAITQPRSNGPVLIATHDRLRWLDSTTGAQIGVSAPIASSFASGNRWKVVLAPGVETVRIVAGSDAGLFNLTVAEPATDTIFFDGLE